MANLRPGIVSIPREHDGQDAMGTGCCLVCIDLMPGGWVVSLKASFARKLHQNA
jgi:hypothetical protein